MGALASSIKKRVSKYLALLKPSNWTAEADEPFVADDMVDDGNQPKIVAATTAVQQRAYESWKPKEAHFFDGFRTDKPMIAGAGQVRTYLLGNFGQAISHFNPALQLGIAAATLAGLWGVVASVQSLETDTTAAPVSWLREHIGFDPSNAVTLPDGQQVHAKFYWLTAVPGGHVGNLNVDGFRKLIDDYRGSITRTPSADEQELARAKDYAAQLEKGSDWNTEAWNLRYRIETSGKTIVKPTKFPTVPAQGFWKADENQEKMASDGVIATDGGSNFFAAAYINGVPAVSFFTRSYCYTLLGVGYEGCQSLSSLSDQELARIRGTLYGDPAKQVAAAPVEEKASEEESRWYLDFPLIADASSFSSTDLDTLTKAVDDRARLPNGIFLHTNISSPVSLLPDAAVVAPAKGLLKNPAALYAMKKGGVVGTTDVPGRVVVAAYVDGKAQVRIRTEGGLCLTLLGDEDRRCRTGDLKSNADLQAVAKSLFEKPDAADQALKPYFWYAAAPMIAETSLESNDIVSAFNAALQDVAYNGDNIGKWTNTPKLKNPPLIARPEGFFAKAENVAALGTTGAVILPKGMKDTFMTAVNFNGHLSLNVIEIQQNGRWNCWTVFGQVGQPIGECRTQDLTKYTDVIKSMFETQK